MGRFAKLNESFFLPGDCCAETQADYDLRHYKHALAQTLYAYYKLPFDIGPTDGHSNLAQALYNRGYVTILRRYNLTLDHSALYEDVEQHFGSELTQKVFGEQSARISSPGYGTGN